MVTRITIMLLSILLLISALAVCVNAELQGRVKAQGILTSVEPDGAVIIDGKGYQVDRSARIVNTLGKSSNVDKFDLPATVLFEFEYTEQGPLIQVIKEIAL